VTPAGATDGRCSIAFEAHRPASVILTGPTSWPTRFSRAAVAIPAWMRRAGARRVKASTNTVASVAPNAAPASNWSARRRGDVLREAGI
jgi:hypothetical protein